MSQPQGPLIEARPKGQLEPRLSPRTRRLVELLVEAEFAARRHRPKRPRKGEPATDRQPEPAQAPTIASLSVAAGYADTDSGRSAARRDVAAAQARAYRSQLRHVALDDHMGAVIGNIAAIAMGDSSSDKAQIEAFDALVRYQQAGVPKGQQAVMVVDYEVSEQPMHEMHDASQGPEALPPQDDPGFGKAGGRAGGESPLTSDLPLVTYDPPVEGEEPYHPDLAGALDKLGEAARAFTAYSAKEAMAYLRDPASVEGAEPVVAYREAAEAVRRETPCLPPGSEWSVIYPETGEVRRVRVAGDGSLLVGERLPEPLYPPFRPGPDEG